MRITLDGIQVECDAKTVGDLLMDHPDGTVAIVNGRHMTSDDALREGDSVHLLHGDGTFRGQLSAPLLSERYTEPVFDRISNARVGIAGLGGMGSHVAIALARSGVGHLVVVDFDRVDQTNLNRQNYSTHDVGKPKSEATARILASVSPGTDVVHHDVMITRDNVHDLFSGCDVVCEAFDDPACKSMLVEELLSSDPNVVIVSCSGMAGFGSPNGIRTIRPMSRLYVCGDGETDASTGAGLVASRVMVCAGHVAHTAIRVILGETEQ